MRNHPARWGATTTLGITPPLIFLLFTANLFVGLANWGGLNVMFGAGSAWVLTTWLMLVLVVAFGVAMVAAAVVSDRWVRRGI